MKWFFMVLLALAAWPQGPPDVPATSGAVQGALRFAGGLRIAVEAGKSATGGWRIDRLRIGRGERGNPFTFTLGWNSMAQISIDRFRIRSADGGRSIDLLLELRAAPEHSPGKQAAHVDCELRFDAIASPGADGKRQPAPQSGDRRHA
jgi:hypothetical protein